MADIESIKNVVAGLRAGIADGTTDLDAVASGLNRVENLLGAGEDTPPQEQRTAPDKRAAADFFARKKRREMNWQNPLKV